MVKPMVKSMVAGIRRYFIQGDSTANTYYELSKPITMEDDFLVSGWFYLVALDGAILGNVAGLTDFLYVQADGKLLIKVANATSSESTLTVSTDLFYYFEMARTGITVTLNIGGVEYISYEKAGDFTVSLIAASSSGTFVDGMVADIAINDVTQSEITTFEISEPVDNIEYPLGNVFGSDLATVNASVIPAG